MILVITQNATIPEVIIIEDNQYSEYRNKYPFAIFKSTENAEVEAARLRNYYKPIVLKKYKEVKTTNKIKRMKTLYIENLPIEFHSLAIKYYKNAQYNSLKKLFKAHKVIKNCDASCTPDLLRNWMIYWLETGEIKENEKS